MRQTLAWTATISIEAASTLNLQLPRLCGQATKPRIIAGVWPVSHLKLEIANY
jgi:hypothetical protein